MGGSMVSSLQDQGRAIPGMWAQSAFHSVSLRLGACVVPENEAHGGIPHAGRIGGRCCMRCSGAYSPCGVTRAAIQHRAPNEWLPRMSRGALLSVRPQQHQAPSNGRGAEGGRRLGLQPGAAQEAAADLGAATQLDHRPAQQSRCSTMHGACMQGPPLCSVGAMGA